ncbi:PREDICTED: uncharacterized protein LOC104605782 [Nelumbo nucifera]|uniref:Uncharacterized protein n=2 Tax=Nelumbo nucifera TaxID=4432 RepID=A0A822XXC1_NELNU|nr:PREDICTED: uncharacterized protein LOC104605782 [Nelumbo nucifera]DAD24662.1 TPA_asm: hypothetical protein HUJ06_026126 [Nelumbo nucifera]
MASKVVLVFVAVVFATFVLLFPLEVAASEYEGMANKTEGRELFPIAIIFRIFRVYNIGEKIYKTVNWTITQAEEYVDGQCFTYCRNDSGNPQSSCECDVSAPNEPPLVTPSQCENFQHHCCNFTIIGLLCKGCCKGPRPQGLPFP